ncbi:hypothetical protein [Agrilutibacter solisilvae]|uniref:Uncharacterized protein n=1 Tax=Agrilutibacter solisilvae TaxID=2763317 RepID=A0A975AR28_9GAMM|nr:hypothetical protein [Lysobacter solisilvae]QSX77494.1 hypothetical protein I8J32_012105 [Lysobacter solisilvae]
MKWILAFILLLPGIAFGRGIAFSEEMHGYAFFKGEFRDVDVYLDVTVQDIDAWRSNPQHAAKVRGWLVVNSQWHSITGTLNILAPAPGDTGRLLKYSLQGTSLKFLGAKHVYDNGGFDLVDDMTTLRGALRSVGESMPTIEDMLYRDAWSSEIRFEWWASGVLWNFTTSFRTIDTPWYQELEVRALFVKTVFGGIASEFFPWLPQP